MSKIDQDKTASTSVLKLKMPADLGPSATAIRDKFIIEQKITNNSAPGNQTVFVYRNVDQNNLPKIFRKFGEGSKPLFDRSDVRVNLSKEVRSQTLNNKHNRKSSSSSSSSTSSSSSSSSPIRRKRKSPPLQKLDRMTYFKDSKREEERLRRREINYKERKEYFRIRRYYERRHACRSYSPNSTTRKYITRHRQTPKSHQTPSNKHIPPVTQVPYPRGVSTNLHRYHTPLVTPMIPRPSQVPHPSQVSHPPMVPYSSSYVPFNNPREPAEASHPKEKLKYKSMYTNLDRIWKKLTEQDVEELNLFITQLSLEKLKNNLS